MTSQDTPHAAKVVDVSDTTPNKWTLLFQRAGIASQRDLAARTGVSPATINRLYHEVGRPDAATVQAVANVLTNGDANAVWQVVGTGHFDYGDFPIDNIADDLRLLTPKQRQSLQAIVRAMADPEGKGGTGHVAEPAQKINDVEVADSEEVEGPKPKQRRGPRNDS